MGAEFLSSLGFASLRAAPSARLAANGLSVWACLLLAAALAAPPEPPPLRVCLLESDPPRSVRRSGLGFDLELARALARDLGRRFEPVWIAAPPPQIDELEGSDLPLGNLLQGACDALASVPGESVLGAARPRVALTPPYYGAAFELVGPDSLPDALAELRPLRVSVQRLSVAHLALERAGVRWLAYDDTAQLIAALDSGAVDAALVWGPSLWAVRRQPRPGFQAPPVLRWNFHWAVRSSDEPLREALDAALARRVASGEVARLLERAGVPPRAPFAQVHSSADLDALQQAGP
jgi:ABC-type amino acid transport substrate-binding protein